MQRDEARYRRKLIQDADRDGRIADSFEFRKKLMERVHAGDITLIEAQAELKRVKRNAKKNGLITRNQAWNGN